MTLKRFLGWILLVVGILLVIIALHAMHKISEAKNVSQDITNFFEHNPDWNPIIKFFGGKAQEKISAYDVPAMLTLISGIILTLLGTIMAIIYRKQHR